MIRITMLIETSLFGVRLTAGHLPSAVESVVQSVRHGTGGIVCVANVDMVTRAKRNPHLFDILRRAAMVVTDGAPLVWALRRKGVSCSRVYGPDLMRALCVRLAVEQLPVFLYGGTTPGELQHLIARLRALAPGLRIAGAVCPPLLPEEPPFDDDIVRQIKASGAYVVFVGLGCPKQEYWMQRHAAELQAVLLGVGLAFAQLAGSKRTAPRWMQQRGLEWLFRLVQEPRRLWKRYLVGNSLFVWYVARESGVFSWRKR